MRGDFMLHVIEHTLLDTLKLIPFLFVSFIIIELFEHKFSLKTKKVINKSGNPIIGALLGAIPQCGFSVVATNLYITRVISLGTLISVYLSTSDEMLPILLSNNVDIKIILFIISIKLIIGMFIGLLIDLLIRRKEEKNDYHICANDNCHCEDGILISSVKHTLKTSLFIFIITFIINFIFEYYGIEYLNIGVKGPFISGLFGLIPNCASSVMITELYINNMLSLGSVVAGLLTNSGVALLILFKENKDKMENIKILTILYMVGVISGIVLDLFM